MSILERSTSPQVSAADSVEDSDRLSVITAGRVGNMDALLGANGFDVVAVAQTEDALIDAVAADEPDAIVVEADMCTSLEHVRDLAPDAVLIVVGDHTPAGALGHIERGVSGTVMAGLLHALVAEGVGAAAVWGLVPALGPRSALQVPQRISGWLLSGKGDLVRAYVSNALRDHTELVTAATAVAVTVSAGVLLTLSGPRTDERPARVPVPASAVERAPREGAPQHRSSLSHRRHPPPPMVPLATRASPAIDGGRTAVTPGILVVTTVRVRTSTTRGRTSTIRSWTKASTIRSRRTSATIRSWRTASTIRSRRTSATIRSWRTAAALTARARTLTARTRTLTARARTLTARTTTVTARTSRQR